MEPSRRQPRLHRVLDRHCDPLMDLRLVHPQVELVGGYPNTLFVQFLRDIRVTFPFLEGI